MSADPDMWAVIRLQWQVSIQVGAGGERNALVQARAVRPAGKRPQARGELRTVANAMLYIARTGCQWRYLPASFGTVDSGLVAVPMLVEIRHLPRVDETIRRGRARSR